MDEPQIRWTEGPGHAPEWVHEFWLHNAPMAFDTRMRTFRPIRLVLTVRWGSEGWDLAQVVMHGRTVSAEEQTEVSYPSVGSRPTWVQEIIWQVLPTITAASPVMAAAKTVSAG